MVIVQGPNSNEDNLLRVYNLESESLLFHCPVLLTFKDPCDVTRLGGSGGLFRMSRVGADGDGTRAARIWQSLRDEILCRTQSLTSDHSVICHELLRVEDVRQTAIGIQTDMSRRLDMVNADTTILFVAVDLYKRLINILR